MSQFHFDPATYLEMIRDELPGYDALQGRLGEATLGVQGEVRRALDLGAGTGMTSRAVLRHHPHARITLLDESPQMLALAREHLGDAVENSTTGDMREPFGTGTYDLVVSSLAVHHLDGSEKQGLFARVKRLVRPGGAFVMADVVVPEHPHDAVIELTPGFDKPDRADDLLDWLRAAGFDAEIVWSDRDLALFVARA